MSIGLPSKIKRIKQIKCSVVLYILTTLSLWQAKGRWFHFQVETQIPLGKVVSGRASSIKLCQSKHVEWLAVGSGKIHFILATLLFFNSYFHSKCWIHQRVRVNVIIYVHNNTDTVSTWHLKRKKWKNLNLENNENNIFHKWIRLTKTKIKNKYLTAVWKLFRTVEDGLLNIII